ncbi:interferon-induced protein with tetratricopeptide repeats 1B-like [Perca fluviatilis]|uniref:interferon-induced protein with tetratricopeptide repeats 1B-like n=1 Tax=Perca fluviatilis TaxID=8168 RepID=UPI0019654EBF|nr:interferon-induced protein with tetratricopeptide repeats 1B-like [Perca fluviatilis]
MMSAAQSQTTLESKLEALQCHFTWDLDPSKSMLLRREEKFEDIGTEEGNSWLGHIYNLRGFVQYKLGFTEDAQSFFNKAAEAFSKIRNADEGPWLVVNYGNLAWLHHHLGDQAESQAYLSKVNALMNKYPSPSQDQLHPEIYAEKGWTLMKFSREQKKEAADYFQRAIRMQPDMVEWNSCYVFGLVYTCDHSDTGQVADLLEKMRIAKEQDPENMFLAVLYLEQCAKKGEIIKEEARELARKVLRNPVSSYSGIIQLLYVYRYHVSIDEAIDLAEEALRTHPDERYLKRCAALCYKWKIMYVRDSRPNPSVIDRAISLHKEVIALYPHSSLAKKIELASIYAKLNYRQVEAEQMYQELLESDLEPADKQMIYNIYAKHLFYDRQYDRSTRNHMNAAAITHQSFYRENSITTLKKNRGRSHMWREVEVFLANLQEP